VTKDPMNMSHILIKAVSTVSGRDRHWPHPWVL